MEMIPKEQVHRNVITSPKKIFYNDVPFVEYTYGQDLEFNDIYVAYFSGSATEYIPNQNFDGFDPTGSVVFHQIPLRYRGYGITPNTFSMTVGSSAQALVDDGYGNLLESGTTNRVGNLFYNSGNIFIYNTGSFSNGGDDFMDIDENSLTKNIRFTREMKFVEKRVYLTIDSAKYTFSTNPSFVTSDAQYPFITKIILYNDNNEAVMVANLSRPVYLDNDISVVLDLLETI
jgi:hypothetical protein